MALQDLTPQLRTRLSRMERAVGWFVLLATALLVFGLGYYVYHVAQRKGWFLTKAPYFTFTDRATGLKVGDPVMLMGLEVGQITRIEPMPPEVFEYNMYVEFEIKDPYYGYMWTVGSRAKVTTADFLGKRVVEVTKGTNSYPTYIFNPLRDVSLKEARSLAQNENWRLAEDIYREDTNGLHLVVPAFTPLTNLVSIAALGRTNIHVLNAGEKRKAITGIWHDRQSRYDFYTKTTKPYWLPSDESPAVTERLEQLVGQVEKALPNFLNLTNQIAAVLSNSFDLTSNLNAVAVNAQPAVKNLAALSAQLRAPGALGEWLLSTNILQVGATLETANTTLAHTDTNLTMLVENLARSLDNLAGITSNLNAQVQANTNILSGISAAIVDTDDLVQGLKRHWLLRSAFRSKTNQLPSALPLKSPKDQGQR